MSISDCALLHGDGFREVLCHSYATIARSTTSLGSTIEVRLSCPASPLLPTMLMVSIPGPESELPRILRTVEDLILFRLPVYPSENIASMKSDDYFIYRIKGAHDSSLELLPHPPTMFRDEDVGLLRREDGHYTVAALLCTSKPGVYELLRFDSVTKMWSSDEVQLVEPQDPFPRKIPRNSSRLLYHLTSTVIPIGGEGGTMGWVDLWRGILLCDVLSQHPKLRGVPVPLPTEHLNRNSGMGTELGCPQSVRGIIFMDKPGMEPCLRFIHLQYTAVLVPRPETEDRDDEEAEFPDWEMRDWTITTWRNSKMTSSWDDWELDCTAESSKTSINSELKSKMLKSGLLRSSSGGKEEPERALQNLFVSLPAHGVDDDNVVYLQARVRFMDPKVFVLALDMKHNDLLGAVQFATEGTYGYGVVHLPCNIKNYIEPYDWMYIPEDNCELSKYEGTEAQHLPHFKISLP